MSVYMRALGAKVGTLDTFRYSNIQTAPDMLRIGEGTHVGDLANMVASCALDAGSVLVAPIDIGKQARAGIHLVHTLTAMRTGCPACCCQALRSILAHIL